MDKEKEKEVSAAKEFNEKIQDLLEFIKFMWGMVPQPPKPEFKKIVEKTDPTRWKASWFGDRIEIREGEYEWEWHDFQFGIHLTWQQTAIVKKIQIEYAKDSKRKNVWISVKSGHGIGKSCVFAMIGLWRLFKKKGAQVACTAPVSQQLEDVLWKEFAIWMNKMPEQFKGIFEQTADRIKVKMSPESWFATAKVGRKENVHALAGIHGKEVTYMADEACGIDAKIFETAEGSMTGKDILFLMAGNPKTSKTYFYDSFNSNRSFWHNFTFSSEESPVNDEEFSNGVVARYGKNSVQHRTLVLGLFPKEDTIDEDGWISLFSEDDVKNAQTEEFDTIYYKLGVDCGGRGKDKSTWVVRNNFVAKIVCEEDISDEMSIARNTNTIISLFKIPQRETCIDNFGVGANVSKHLAFMGKDSRGVNVGDPSSNKQEFINLKAEASRRMYEWIKRGGKLVEDDRWKELEFIKYIIDEKGRMKMMPKKEMLKKLKIMSPNIFDALLLTFIEPIQNNVPDTSPLSQSYHTATITHDPTMPF